MNGAALRARLYHQLVDGRAAGHEAHGRGLSRLNRWLCGIIAGALLVTVLASEPVVFDRAPRAFTALEFGFGLAFLAEYLLRLWTAAEAPGPGGVFARRVRFALSPLAIIDLVVVVTALAPAATGNFALLRAARFLRLLAFAKFGRFSEAFHDLAATIHERRHELYVTLVLASVLLLAGASALYLIEGEVQPDKFGSIPRALWWSIITLTTVGYGDVAPITPLGKFAASIVALAGIGLVAMPTGIMAAAFTEAMQRRRDRENGRDGG